MVDADALKSVLQPWINQRHQALLEQVMMTWQDGMRGLEPDAGLLEALARAAAAGAAPDGDGDGDLGLAVEALEAAPSQAEVLRALLDGLSPFAPRAALFVVKQGGPGLYAARGFAGDGPRLGAPVMPTPELASLLAGQVQVLRGAGPAYGSLLVPLGGPTAADALVLPLRLRRRPVAVLLVDSGEAAVLARPAAVRALAHTAGSCLSSLAAQREEERTAPAAAAPPPAPAPPPPPPAAPVEPDLDPKVRATAERLARVMVGDLELYSPLKIAQGKASGNLYAALREDLDRCHGTFLDRYGEDLEARHHIFRDTIVQMLCGGDPARLGPAPWAAKAP